MRPNPEALSAGRFSWDIEVFAVVLAVADVIALADDGVYNSKALVFILSWSCQIDGQLESCDL